MILSKYNDAHLARVIAFLATVTVIGHATNWLLHGPIQASFLLTSPFFFAAAAGGLVWFWQHPNQEPRLPHAAIWPFCGLIVCLLPYAADQVSTIFFDEFSTMTQIYLAIGAINIFIFGQLLYWGLRKVPAWVATILLGGTTAVTLYLLLTALPYINSTPGYFFNIADAAAQMVTATLLALISICGTLAGLIRWRPIASAAAQDLASSEPVANTAAHRTTGLRGLGKYDQAHLTRMITFLTALAVTAVLLMVLIGGSRGFDGSWVYVTFVVPHFMGTALGGLVWFWRHPNQQPTFSGFARWPLAGFAAVLAVETIYFLVWHPEYLTILRFIPAGFTYGGLTGLALYLGLRKIGPWVCAVLLGCCGVLSVMFFNTAELTLATATFRTYASTISLMAATITFIVLMAAGMLLATFLRSSPPAESTAHTPA